MFVKGSTGSGANIGYLSKKGKFWINEIARYLSLRWVPEGYSLLQQPPCLYSDVIMITMASQISSASLAFVQEFTGELTAQRASNAENASIWWRYNGSAYSIFLRIYTSWFWFCRGYSCGFVCYIHPYSLWLLDWYCKIEAVPVK